MVLIQKEPLSDRYPISDVVLFSNYFVTSGYHRFIYYYLFLICDIFYVNNHFLSISHVVNKFRLFARTLKIAIFQYLQKITKLQLKTYAIILLAFILEYTKMFELIGPRKRLSWCSNIPQGYILHLKTLFRTSEIGSMGWNKVNKSSLEPPKYNFVRFFQWNIFFWLKKYIKNNLGQVSRDKYAFFL